MLSIYVSCALHSGYRKRVYRVKGTRLDNVSSHAHGNEEVENADALEDFINKSGSVGHGRILEEETQQLIQRNMIQEQRNIQKKIIERKYFKKAMETNVLTWRAKEQICYLHNEFPDEWTPEVLAKSFPVSLHAVYRILRSSYRPRNEDEIEEHDRRVAVHWQQLKRILMLRESLRATDDKSCNFQHVIDSGKLPLMINAGGSQALPKSMHQKTCETKKKMGVFESIVADSKLVYNLEHVKKSMRIEQNKPQYKLLEDIAKSVQSDRET